MLIYVHIYLLPKKQKIKPMSRKNSKTIKNSTTAIPFRFVEHGSGLGSQESLDRVQSVSAHNTEDNSVQRWQSTKPQRQDCKYNENICKENFLLTFTQFAGLCRRRL